ncbi:MAG: hypothetical protein ACLTI1_08310 [Clostridia bacterium]
MNNQKPVCYGVIIEMDWCREMFEELTAKQREKIRLINIGEPQITRKLLSAATASDSFQRRRRLSSFRIILPLSHQLLRAQGYPSRRPGDRRIR